MANSAIFSLAAVLALLPASLAALRGSLTRDARLWLLLGVAAAGPLAWTLAQAQAGWATGFAAALWVTITACMVMFIILAMITRHAWRLTPLLLPYLCVLAVVALIWSQAPARPLLAQAPPVWIAFHIIAAVITYGLITLAAIAGAAVLIQEGALKRKRRQRLFDRLPSVADAERLEVGLLAAAESVLGIGIATGMATQYFTSGNLLTIDHKTIFVLGAFALIGLLLIAHYRVGLRGRRAARVVLVGYLLLTLAYPGVKFVTNVLFN